MKKTSICCWLCAATVAMAGCINSIPDDYETSEKNGTKKICFQTRMETEPMSRAALKDAFSVLDYRRVTAGVIAHSATQKAQDENFGRIEDVLPYGKHTCFFVGHQSEITSMKADGVVTFSKVTDTFSAKAELDVNAKTKASQAVTLIRRVAKLEIVCTDALPDNLKTMEMVIEGGSVTLNAATGKGGVVTEQRKTIQIPTSNIGVKNCTFSSYVFLPEESDTVKVTATAKDVSGSIICTHTFDSVEMQTNYITRYTGSLFSEDQSFQLSVNSEWAGTKDYPF